MLEGMDRIEASNRISRLANELMPHYLAAAGVLHAVAGAVCVGAEFSLLEPIAKFSEAEVGRILKEIAAIEDARTASPPQSSTTDASKPVP
jgi:hypothetical protein